MEKLLGTIYQYLVLISVIVLLLISFLRMGEFNDMLLGALIGVMVQLPIGVSNNKEE